jgi:hypothetical protein
MLSGIATPIKNRMRDWAEDGQNRQKERKKGGFLVDYAILNSGVLTWQAVSTSFSVSFLQILRRRHVVERPNKKKEATCPSK